MAVKGQFKSENPKFYPFSSQINFIMYHPLLQHASKAPMAQKFLPPSCFTLPLIRHPSFWNFISISHGDSYKADQCLCKQERETSLQPSLLIYDITIGLSFFLPVRMFVFWAVLQEDTVELLLIPSTVLFICLVSPKPYQQLIQGTNYYQKTTPQLLRRNLQERKCFCSLKADDYFFGC